MSTVPTTISEQDFDFVRELVRRRSAIVLEPGKEYLVEARLGPIARRIGAETMTELVDQLRARVDGDLSDQVIEAMTTNETSFFRDVHPFDAMREVVIPTLLERRKNEKALRLWSAACSSGQESYSLTVLLRENFPMLDDWSVKILATDLSTEMVERTAAGRFSQLEVNRGLPMAYLVKWFDRDGVSFVAKPELRSMVETQLMNLARPFPILPRFDVVFLRNVLIYFDVETKQEILNNVRSVLRPDGYLFLGSAETTINIDSSWTRRQIGRATCYQPGEGS